jgi:predicted transcriptional regulator
VPAPRSVEWNALSLASREVARHVTLREAAGYTYDEIALQLQRDRPELRHLPAPSPSKGCTKAWVSARARELRREIEATGAATY